MNRSACVNSRYALVIVAIVAWAGQTAVGQVVINEYVYDEAQASSTDVVPDTREFIELYNAGATAVNIGDWKIARYTLVDGSEVGPPDVLPTGTVLAPGDYYVIGKPGPAYVDFPINEAGELFIDINSMIELRDSSDAIIDALAVETNKGMTGLQPNQIAQIAGGWWGNTQSYNTSYTQLSLGRFIDGRDTNNNGRDFGTIPLTPGASNTLPLNANYSVPNVDALAIGAPMPGATGSFYQARTIDPTVAYQPGVDIDPLGANYDNPAINLNPNAIPASPQGGKALIAWDPSGGGNFVTSVERVTKYDLWAYVNTTPYGEAGNESSAYGIGTAGPLFNNSNDPLGVLTTPTTITSNDATGVFWLVQKETQVNEPDHVKLILVDANDGGNSRPQADPLNNDWTVITSIDLAGQPSDWHRLSIEVGAGGAVTAKHNDQVFSFNTSQDLIGTFWVGYRESLTGTPITGYPTKVRPPTFDMVAAVTNDANFDNDTDVDGRDFLTWQRGFGGPGNNLAGDANGDGQVNSADYGIWRSQFGSTGLTSAAGSPVPEPASLVLFACAVGLFAAARRK